MADSLANKQASKTHGASATRAEPIDFDGTAMRSPISALQLIIWLLVASGSLAVVLIGPELKWPPHFNFPALFPVQDTAPPIPAIPQNENDTDKNYPEYAPDVFPTISPLKTGSITPVRPSSGITILARTPLVSISKQTTPPQYAISLGQARALSTLSKRFGLIAAMNNKLFENLEPRAVFFDHEHGLRAMLVAGPFALASEALKTCGILRLPGDIVCTTQLFDGDLIARQ